LHKKKKKTGRTEESFQRGEDDRLVLKKSNLRGTTHRTRTSNEETFLAEDVDRFADQRIQDWGTATDMEGGAGNKGQAQPAKHRLVHPEIG